MLSEHAVHKKEALLKRAATGQGHEDCMGDAFLYVHQFRIAIPGVHQHVGYPHSRICWHAYLPLKVLPLSKDIAPFQVLQDLLQHLSPRGCAILGPLVRMYNKEHDWAGSMF
jgi:hypothetical protein